MVAYTGTIAIAPRWEPGATYTAVGTYTRAGTYAANDTVTFAGLIPGNGVEIQAVRFTSDELDTGASPTATVSVGDTTTAAQFISARSVGLAASGATQVNISGDVVSGIGKVYTTATDVVVTFPAAFATSANPSTLSVAVTYFCSGKA